MEYRFSTLVDPSTYETHGLCDGIAVRKHMNPEIENRGALQAQKDWARLVRPVGFYRGGLGPEYNFIQVIMPECRPERLGIISYLGEFGFLYDGKYFTVLKL